MKRSIKILSFIFIFFCLFCIKSNAFEINFGNTPAQVSPGESFTVEISTSVKSYLSNGHIKYDSNLFTYEGVEGQPNMSANIYSNDGDLAWMYTEISNAPVGTDLLKFKFKAKKVTQTSSGDFIITGIDDEEGAKFITNKEYTYSGNEIGGRKKQTVTIYVPDSLIVSPKDMELIVGDSQVISVNKKGSKFESRDENIATVDQNGNVTGVNVGNTVIKVTDKDGMTAEIIVTVKNKATLKNSDNSTVNKILPQTGGEWLKTIAVLALIIFAIIIFVRYKKYRKLFIVLFLMGTVLIPNFVEAFMNVDSTKIKSGIFKNLDGVDNVVAISPNNSFKYGQSLVKSEIEEKDAVFDKNNLGVKSVKDKNDRTLSDGTPLATGYKIQAYVLGYEDEITDYNLVLYGDADGNATFCDNDDINVIRNDYVYKRKATGVYKTAANLYAYDDILDVSDIQRMILKRFDNLKALIGKDGTDGRSDSTLVNPFPEADSPITLEPNKIKLDLGDSKDIKASGQKGSLTWTSRDPEIATVDENGKITGVKKGNTIITATDSEGNSATVYVIVKNPATSVIVDPNTWITELDDHETKELKYTLTPDTIPLPDAKITWSSSDEKIATVSEDGVVTPVSVGKVDITVTAYVPAEDTADGVARTLTDVCKVVINQAASEDDSYVDPTDVTLNLNEKYNEKTKDLTIYLSPEYSNSTVEWKIQDGRKEVKFTDTTDTTAKTVTIEGVDVTSSDLKVTVTVTNQNENLPGFTKDVTVRVIKSASEIKDIKGLDPSKVDDKNKGDKVTDGTKYPIIDGTLILPNDTTYYMGVEYDPEDSTSEVKWNSDKEDIATIDSINKKTGKITTNKDKQGYTNIKATTTDKNVESQPVKVYVAKIDLKGTDTVEAGLDIKDITATVYPADLRNNTIKWEIADTSIATVDENGIVHGVKEGKTTLTATLCAQDESKTAVYATMPITVNPKLDIKDEDGSDVKDGKEIIMSVDSIRNFTTNTKGDILKIEVIDDDKCLDNVTATDGAIKIDSSTKPGTAKIKISYKTGVTEYINVSIIVGKMTISPESEKIFLDQTTRINLESILPTALRMKNETVEWSIDTKNSEAKDATIKSAGRESGILTPGKQIGKVVIIGAYGNTGITAKCEVTIRRELKITTGDTLLVAKDGTEQITTSWDNSELTFTSEDKTIADVGQNTGLVTGKKAGITKVTVTTPDGQSKVVTVTVGQITLSGQNILEQEKTTDIVATIAPQTLSNYRIKWESNKTNIATVDNNGTVKGISPGTATITATLIDNNGNETKIKSSINITVNTKLDLVTDEEIIIAVNGTREIKTTADDTAIDFKSNNEDIATVNNNGVVTGKKVGTTTITIKYKSGITTTLKVNVIVGSITLEDKTISIESTAEIEKTVSPSTLALYPIQWTSNNTKIATVGKSSGVVTGVGSGKAIITAKVLDKAGNETGIQATCTVTVVGNLEIKASDMIIAKNEKNVQIPYTYDGDASDITWSSSSNIATVSNGTVSGGASAGTTIVTAKNKLNGKNATIRVIVGEITLSGESNVEVDSTTLINKTIKPTEIENNKVKWVSSNPSVATIDESGNVNALKEGSTTITATVLDFNGNTTNITATKDITVRRKIEAADEELLIPLHSSKTINTNIAGNTGLTFTSNDKSIATVDGAGTVTGVAVGETKIIVTYATGVSKVVTVKVIVGSISITNTKVMVGDSVEVPRTILPSALSAYPIKWISGNTEIATIGTSSGIVTGKKTGTATITAKILNKSGSETGIQATCTVTVISELAIDAENMIISKGEKAQIPYTYGGSASDLKWESSNSQIASVSNGTVTGGKTTGTITAKATNNLNGKTATIKVIVGEITLSGESSIEVGSTTLINKTIKPAEIENNKVKWTSNNPSVATIDDAGNVNAIKEGTTTITAIVLDSNGNETSIKATKDIIVKKQIEATEDEIILSVGGTQKIATNVAGNTGLTFISENKSIATVDGSGVVKGVAVGETKILVTYSNGVSKTINVKIIVGSIKLQNTNVMVGNSAEIPRTILPSVLSTYPIKWTSNNTNIATVGESSGIVTGKNAGTATITAKILNKSGVETGIQATCTVTVISDLVINAQNMIIAKGQTAQIPYTYGGSSRDISWKSSSTSIATVSGGSVTGGQTPGTITATATNSLNGKTATIKIIVGEITLSGDSSVEEGLSILVNKTIKPTEIENNKVKWTSSDTTKATVDDAGNVKGIKAGTATISATVLDFNGNSTKIVATKTITVKKSLVVNNDKIIIPVNGTEKISTNVAGNTGLSFSSSNSNIATVDGSGIVTGKATGTTKITVTYESGESKEVLVTVIVGSLTLTNTTVKVGSTVEIPRAVQPSALNSYGIEWSSNNTTIATVGASTGLVKGIKEGTATITAKISGTSISKTCTVTVIDDLVINDDEMVVAKGNSRNINFTYSGDISNLTATSSSDNCSVSISGNNIVVTGKINGEATITVRNKNTNKQDTIKVIVMDFSMSGYPQVVPGQMIATQVSNLPSTLTGGVYTYKSLNDNIATVSSGGIVTAKAIGTATIQVTLTKDGQSITHSNVLNVVQGTTTITGPYGDNLTNAKIDTVVGHLPIALKAGSSSSTAGFLWSSNNSQVASVDSNGNVKIVGAGQAIISLRNTVGSTVTVTINVINMSVSAPKVLYYPGRTDTGEHPRKQTLSASVTSNPSVTGNTITYKWSSDDKTKATVNSSGFVTAVSNGNANIICEGTLSGTYGGTINIEKTITINNDAVAQVVKSSSGVTTTIPYAILNLAFEKYDSGDTIQLVDNIDSIVKFGDVDQIEISKNTTFDLNGYNLFVGGESNVFGVSGGVFNIKNSKTSGGVSINETFVYGQKSSTVVNVENVKIQTNANVAFNMDKESTINVKSGSITSSGNSIGTIVLANKAKAKITGGTITGSTHAIYNNGEGNIQLYIDDSNESINIKSTKVSKDTEEVPSTATATIRTNGNIKIGNNSDNKIYTSAGKTKLDDFEDSRPSLYIGGGNYGIQQFTNETASVPSKIYWYNGEIQGENNSIMINEPDKKTKKINFSANFSVTLSDMYTKGNDSGYWGIAEGENNEDEFNYVSLKGLHGGTEQALVSTPKDLYYVNRSVLYGDLNLDGKVDLTDSNISNRIAAGAAYTETQLKNGDLDKDGDIDNIDAALLLGFIARTIKVLPVTSGDKYIIGSKTLGIMRSATSLDDLSFTDNAKYMPIKTNVPFDIQSLNNNITVDKNLHISYFSTSSGSRIDKTLGSDDFSVDGNYVTLKKTMAEIISKYNDVNTSKSVYLFFKINNENEILTESVENVSSTVLGDFNGDGKLDYCDYVMLSEYYNKNVKFATNSYDSNVLKNFKTYVKSQGYTNTDEDTCLYVLRKKILLDY